jgi:hypothetical protein
MPSGKLGPDSLSGPTGIVWMKYCRSRGEKTGENKRAGAALGMPFGGVVALSFIVAIRP